MSINYLYGINCFVSIRAIKHTCHSRFISFIFKGEKKTLKPLNPCHLRNPFCFKRPKTVPPAFWNGADKEQAKEISATVSLWPQSTLQMGQQIKTWRNKNRRKTRVLPKDRSGLGSGFPGIVCFVGIFSFQILLIMRSKVKQTSWEQILFICVSYGFTYSTSTCFEASQTESLNPSKSIYEYLINIKGYKWAGVGLAYSNLESPLVKEHETRFPSSFKKPKSWKVGFGQVSMVMVPKWENERTTCSKQTCRGHEGWQNAFNFEISGLKANCLVSASETLPTASQSSTGPALFQHGEIFHSAPAQECRGTYLACEKTRNEASSLAEASLDRSDRLFSS